MWKCLAVIFGEFECESVFPPLAQFFSPRAGWKKRLNSLKILVFLTLGSFEIPAFLACSSESRFPAGSLNGELGTFRFLERAFFFSWNEI